MFNTFIETRFSAAHQLHGYQGQCGKLHGHTWKLRVEVRCDSVDALGISIDFKELRRITESVTDALDHGHINTIPPFDKSNPTAENLSIFIFREVGKRLPPHVRMAGVTVWESEQYAVTYTES
ncbi:6-carboxytetrahydropterin synthase QueD [bacterium]|nr:6-carboxytetrahydropterin synthase QueD [bacterium]